MSSFDAYKAVPRFVEVTGDKTFAATSKATYWGSVNARGEEHILNYDSDPTTFFYTDSPVINNFEDFGTPLCPRLQESMDSFYANCVVDPNTN